MFNFPGDEEVTWPAEPRNDDVVAQHGPDETKDEYLAGRGEEAPSSRPVRFVLYILSGNLGVMVKWAVIPFFFL